MKIEGACHCGYIKVEGEADPEKTTICHCTDCQTQTGTAFRVSIPVAGATFKMTAQPATYLKVTPERRTPRLLFFNATSTTQIYTTTPGEAPQPSYTVRVGILRQRDQFVPKRQIWARSAQPWVAGIVSMQRHEKQG
jgi:hypothetical protein